MVEQAVQTAPLAAAAQRKGGGSTQVQGRQPVQPMQRSARSGAQIQKENMPAGGSSRLCFAQKNHPSFFFLVQIHKRNPHIGYRLYLETVFHAQVEQHHSRVQARLRAKALQTRSKSQNKVLLLRIACLK